CRRNSPTEGGPSCYQWRWQSAGDKRPSEHVRAGWSREQRAHSDLLLLDPYFLLPALLSYLCRRRRRNRCSARHSPFLAACRWGGVFGNRIGVGVSRPIRGDHLAQQAYGKKLGAYNEQRQAVVERGCFMQLHGFVANKCARQ